MDIIKSELHYYLREKQWHHAITFCTSELKKGRDSYISFWRSFAHSQEGNLIEAIRDAEPLQDDPDFKYSSTVALLTYHNMYATPDTAKINKLTSDEMSLESSLTVPDTVNAMRFFTYLHDDEKFNDLNEKLSMMEQGEDSEELIVKGWKYAMENDEPNWTRAQGYFERYIKEYGNENIDAILGGLKCLERMKKFETILDTYQEIIKMNSDFMPLHIERVKIYISNKSNYDNANDYITSRFANAQNYEFYEILALCNLFQDGDFKTALYNLNKMWDLMLKTEPKNPELYYQTGKLFSRTCDRNKDVLTLCETMIDKAIEFNPKCAKYLIERAYIRLYFGEIDIAAELFSKCSEMDTANKDSSLGLIYIKILQGKYKEASEDIKFMKEMNEATASQLNHKFPLFDAIIGSNTNAREDYVLQCVKESLTCYVKYNRSIAPWNKFEALIAAEYDTLYDMAKVLLDYYSFDNKVNLNSIPDTVRQAERILTLLKKNKYMISSALLNGKLMFIKSNMKEAMNEVNGVLSIDSKNLEALMMKAMFCIDVKDFTKAKEVITDAMINNLTETKESAAFLILKSKCELGLNDTLNAQKSLNDAIEKFDKTMNEGNVSSNRCSLFKLRKNDKLELMKINIDILLKLGKTEDAQAYMNKLVIEFQDLGDELLMLHSDLALKTDDIKKAVNLLRKIGDKDEKLFKKSRIKLSQIYISKIMDRRLYAYCYNEILEKFPTFENYKLAANAMMEINDPDNAVDYFKAALNSKSDMEVMRDLGKALVKTHDYKEAIAYYMEATRIDERAINNQTVLHYWEMCDDFIALMYLLSQNNNTVEEKKNKLTALKKQIEDNITKLLNHFKKYDDYRLKDIYAKIKFVLAKVIKEIYIEDNNAFNKVEIFKCLEDTLKFEKDALNRMKELKNEDMIKKARELLSDIWYNIGDYYEKFDIKLDFCEKAYVESVNNNQSNIPALYSLSNLYMKKANYNEAQRYIDMLLHEDESNEDALALLISVLNAKKSNESSITYLETTIAKQPNAYHLIELYIEILRRSGTLSNAKEILYKSERTLKYTYTPGLYYCKGLFYKYMGETNKALIEFSKAKTDEDYGIKCIEQMLEIYINPDSDVLLIDLDIPWNAANDKGTLINYNTEMLNKDAINFLLRELKTRRDDEMTKVYETYVAIISKDEAKMNEKANVLQDVLNKNKDNLSAWIALIMLNLVMKKISEVKNNLKIMDKITLNIKFYTDYERGFLILAYLMMMTDNLKKAEEYLRKVLVLNVAQIKAYEFLAMIKDKQKKYEESCAYYEKAWDYSNKNNANIGYKLAISFINSRQHVKALNICNEIKRKFPQYPIDELAIQAKNGLN